MDAERLRRARNLGGVTTDISSRSQIYNTSKEKEGGWFGLLRHKKPK